MRMLSVLAGLSLAAAAAAAAAQPMTDYRPVTVNQIALERSEPYTSASGAALHGFDTVAYHTQGAPRPGNRSIQARYNGAVWLFASEANRERFLADPARYAPAFNGHCAYAAAVGSKAAGNPHLWHIEDGVLYVNLNEGAQARFLQDVPGNIASAVTNWNDGSGGLFRGGPLYQRSAANPLTGVAGEVDPA